MRTTIPTSIFNDDYKQQDCCKAHEPTAIPIRALTHLLFTIMARHHTCAKYAHPPGLSCSSLHTKTPIQCNTETLRCHTLLHPHTVYCMCYTTSELLHWTYSLSRYELTEHSCMRLQNLLSCTTAKSGSCHPRSNCARMDCGLYLGDCITLAVPPTFTISCTLTDEPAKCPSNET